MTTNQLLLAAVILVLVCVVVVVVRLLILKKDVESYRNYWRQRAGENVVGDALVYVALGDSAAQGIGATTPDKGYVGVLVDYISEKAGRPVRIINLSVSGAKVRDVITTQIPQLKAYPSPDIITIEIGANDMFAYDADQFQKDYQDLMPLLPDCTVMSNMPTFLGGRINPANERANEANSYLDQTVGRRKIAYADLHSLTKGLGLWDFASDFFHPNDKTYGLWANAFKPGIDAVLTQTPKKSAK